MVWVSVGYALVLVPFLHVMVVKVKVGLRGLFSPPPPPNNIAIRTFLEEMLNRRNCHPIGFSPPIKNSLGRINWKFKVFERLVLCMPGGITDMTLGPCPGWRVRGAGCTVGWPRIGKFPDVIPPSIYQNIKFAVFGVVYACTSYMHVYMQAL